MAGTITQKTKVEAKEMPKDLQLAGIKESRELVPLVVGSYLTHSPSNVASKQIVRSDNKTMFRTSISYQRNLSLYKIS
jgi:hypothetical protein